MVRGVAAGDPEETERFVKMFSPGTRAFLRLRLGHSDLDDHLHNCLLRLIESIRKTGGIREPDRLSGFIRTILRRYIAQQITELISERSARADPENLASMIPSKAPCPEQLAIEAQRQESARQVLDGQAPRDREVLRRFYLLGQAQQQIMAEMDLDSHAFRNLKCRAKLRFTEAWNRLYER